MREKRTQKRTFSTDVLWKIYIDRGWQICYNYGVSAGCILNRTAKRGVSYEMPVLRL